MFVPKPPPKICAGSPAAIGSDAPVVILHLQVKLDMEKVGQMQCDQVQALFEGLAKVLNAQRPNTEIRDPRP